MGDDSREVPGEVRVNLRWQTAQVEMIKRAARLAGVPYQTWIKQVAWRHAIQELKDAQGADAVAE